MSHSTAIITEGYAVHVIFHWGDLKKSQFSIRKKHAYAFKGKIAGRKHHIMAPVHYNMEEF